MKYPFLAIIILITLIPNFASANHPSKMDSECDSLWDRCYDPNLSMQVGDVFRWTILEHIEQGEPFNYGMNHTSTHNLVIGIEILQELQGVMRGGILWTADYFKINTTINNKPLNGSWAADDRLPFSTMHNGIYLWSHLISPTIILKDKGPINFYQFISNLYPKGYEPPRQNRDDSRVNYSQSVNDGIHDISEVYLSGARPISKNEIITDIHNGLVLQINHQSGYVKGIGYTTSLLLRLDGYVPSKGKFIENQPVVRILIFLEFAVATVFWIYYRKPYL